MTTNNEAMRAVRRFSDDQDAQDTPDPYHLG